MKYLILLSLVFLAGCGNSDSAEKLGVVIGKVVTIKRGFYKGCTGMVSEYRDYDAIDDIIVVQDAKCGNGTLGVSVFSTEAKNLY